jgi:hypothetical protein
MLLFPNKQLLSKDTLWKQSAITSSSLKAFSRRRLLREVDQRYRLAEKAARWFLQ